jgi:hypothetical protein
MSYGHEFRSAPIVTGRMLLLEYAVTVWIPVLCVREVLTTQQPVDEIIQLLFVAAVAVFILGWLTWSWMESRCFRESVCRLSALPAASVSAFDAEIECNLPLESPASVVVRLESRVALSKFPRRHWQVEYRVDPSEVRPLGAGRVIVPVRFDIPGHRPVAAQSGAVWALEIACSRWGMTFRTEFVVPLMDASARVAEPLAQ